ncbi:MAG: calcium-translocating P-type ATPase, PMCA-type [Firmicutes bacterium]|nr:calcium-translocating P-type ATPase, PMCA-type [Bacillota bacterium]
MGLNENEVVESRNKYGTNELTEQKNNTFWQLLIESLGDPIIKILLIALAIKVVVLFRNFDWYETIGILIAIFLASFISTISEYGSEQSFKKLHEKSANIKCKVWRSNKLQEININDIVVGDVVDLSSGDKIPADGHLIKGSLMVDESSLNGETKEAKKEAVVNKCEDKNKVYRGCVVYEGEAKLKVTEVGDKTIYGKISQELQKKVPDSPLKEKLRGLAKIISKIGYCGALLASLSYLFSVIVINNNFDWDLIIVCLQDKHFLFNHLIYALTLSVTIIVVAVPEGLPMMITLVLSSNMKKMLKDNVLVRKLVGIETSGSLNLLLTDKTGTLTKGTLKVVDFLNYNGKHFLTLSDLKKYPKFYECVYISCFYNNSSTFSDKLIIGGNITDRAILEYIQENKNITKIIQEKKPFSSQLKYSYVLINGEYYIKGAAEIILDKCHSYLDLDGNIKVNFNKQIIIKHIESLTKKASRIIVFARGRSLNNLTFIGFSEIKDELRSEAKNAIFEIKKAGIQTIMITGDAKQTATSIAKEVGLYNNLQYLVLESKEFNNLSDEKVKSILPNIAVIARALPSDKSRLVEIAQKMNLTVGMTGDGVNDAPALKKANVGFAMGSGTDVAKEAADIVILDNNIVSISKAILYGRTIFKSIRRFIIYQLTVNMCALILSIVGSLIGVTSPITIIQMLWLNMIMDTFSGLAFSFEAPLKEYMDELPKKKDDAIMNKYMFSQIIWTGTYNALLCILFLKLPLFKNLIRYSLDNKYLMTAYFAMFIFLGIFNAFNARTERINIFANLKHNKVFILIFTFIFIAQIYIIYNGGDLFRTYGLTFQELILVLFLALTVFPIDIIRKIMLKKNKINLKI